MRPEAEMWWQQAQAELAAARDLLRDGHFSSCAFFAQQATEKALKALWLVRHRSLPPKTHDLTTLGEGLSAPERLGRKLRELNPLFATARYPDAANGVPARMFDRAIAEERLRDAEEVIDWCRGELASA